MRRLTIYDRTFEDSLGSVRGGGRIAQVLRESLKETARFVNDTAKIDSQDTLLVPGWQPFKSPSLTRRIAHSQILFVYDAIPLKYPEHFPIGIRGRWRLIQNLHALSNYDGFLTLSEHAKSDIVDHLNLDPDRIRVVYPTSTERFFSRKVLPSRTTVWSAYTLPHKPYVIYVGDTNWNKNLVTMARGIIKSGVDCVCVGKTFSIIQEMRTMDTEEQHDLLATSPLLNHYEQIEFKEFVKLTLNDTHFFFPGYVPDSELAVLYRHARANILFSRDEGFGLSYLESARMSCPSILSDTPVFREIAGDTAYFADVDSPDILASSIRLAMKKSARYADMQKKAHFYTRRYTPQSFASSLTHALDSLTQGA